MSSTIATAFFQGRRAEFDTNAANRALSAMRRGAQLRLEYGGGRPCWSLSGGRAVTPEVASIIIASPLVKPAGDALFGGMSQTWRYVS
jgi:hypothetical protein